MSEVPTMAQLANGVPATALNTSLLEPTETMPGSPASQLLRAPACAPPISIRASGFETALPCDSNPFSFLLQAPPSLDLGPTHGIQDGLTLRPLT